MTNINCLANANVNVEYIIKDINTHNDSQMYEFLSSLGCYAGEKITIISKLYKNYVVSIKDARYSIDEDLAKSIIL